MKPLTIIFLFASCTLLAQLPANSAIYKTIKENDSLLFNIGFNTCDLEMFETLIDSDFEFYHDQSGILNSKTAFIENLSNGLCASNGFQARRELVSGSLKIYPLYSSGTLYGALQTGIHNFYEKQKGKEEVYGSTALFSHLWVLIDDEWKLSRVVSYDHRQE